MRQHTIDDFDFALPESLIAQFPAEKRRDSRLLVVSEKNNANVHIQFPNIVDYIQPRDLLIFNDTRVINARLHGNKDSGGKIECLIERVLDEHHALAHIRASHAPKVGAELVFENVVRARVIAREGSLFHLVFLNAESVWALLEQYGHLPLPPYITRDVKREDFDRYQTVYAKNPGAVAAPTAGLHFDDALLSTLKDNGVDIGFVTLHVGAGTFQPVRVDHIADHQMHHEYIMVSDALCEKIKACRERGGRVIAVGTTVVRALESAALSGEIQPFSGETNIFITPGFQFRVVDQLLTNFHLPKSTLLMLVSAFAGYERVMQAYQEAIAEQYRFFSYGDAMLLSRV